MAIKKKAETSAPKLPDCFIIMPISDPDGYPAGHFKHVYEDIIIPSCEKASFKAVRGDDVKQANLIHLDILKRLLDAPMAICDLSSRNPNVLFELGIRQAFDKPVVLIQEIGTPKIFDISPLRTIEYSKEMKYHDVLSFHEQLSEAISATDSAQSDSENINSIVKLLSLNAAQLPELNNHKESMSLSLIQSEMRDLRRLIEINLKANQTEVFLPEASIGHGVGIPRLQSYRRRFEKLNILHKNGNISDDNLKSNLKIILTELEDYADSSKSLTVIREAQSLHKEIDLYASL